MSPFFVLRTMNSNNFIIDLIPRQPVTSRLIFFIHLIMAVLSVASSLALMAVILLQVVIKQPIFMILLLPLVSRKYALCFPSLLLKQSLVFFKMKMQDVKAIYIFALSASVLMENIWLLVLKISKSE